MLLTLAALAALALPQTDTTIAVRPGVRLDVNNFGGSITVKGWNQSTVRVQADHSSHDEIEIAAREHASKPLDRRDGGVVRGLDAEHDLNIAPIVLDAERAQIIEQTRLVAVKRFENGHRRRSSGAHPTAMPRNAAQEYRGHQEICAADDGDCRCGDRRPEQDHPLARPIRERGSIGARAGKMDARTGDPW